MALGAPAHTIPDTREAHCFLHLAHGERCLLTHAVSASDDELIDQARFREVLATLAQWREGMFQNLDEILLDLDIADGPCPVALLEGVDRRYIDTEGIQIGKNRVTLNPPRDICGNPIRVRIHPHDLAPDLLRAVAEVDRIAPALAHLCGTIGPNECRDVAVDCLRYREDLAISAVESPCQFP